MNLVFLGPPGAGKGSQAALVCEKYSIPHISTGNMLRAAIAQKTSMGLAAKKNIDAGNLVPDDVVIEIVKQRLAEDDCKNGYLLDGFPRTIAQAQKLDEFATLDLVILVDVDDKSIIKRLSRRRTCVDCSSTYDISKVPEDACHSCGGRLVRRTDDSKETIKNRLNVYHELTSPLVTYYKDSGRLCKVDGKATIEVVFSAVSEVLDTI
ncbi:MAG: adenylate kinase [Clostridiales bacterium]|nr:adenylate kinase [Clostridiales bacterium]